MTPQKLWHELYPMIPEKDGPSTWDLLVKAIAYERKRRNDRQAEIEERILAWKSLMENKHYDPKIGELTFLCPVCGGSYMHIQRVKTLLCGDESGEGPYEGIEPTYCQREEESSWRRAAVVIEIDGESCGHSFRLRVQQHKGELFIFTERMCWEPPQRPIRLAIDEVRAIFEGKLPEPGARSDLRQDEPWKP